MRINVQHVLLTLVACGLLTSVKGRALNNPSSLSARCENNGCPDDLDFFLTRSLGKRAPPPRLTGIRKPGYKEPGESITGGGSLQGGGSTGTGYQAPGDLAPAPEPRLGDKPDEKPADTDVPPVVAPDPVTEPAPIDPAAQAEATYQQNLRKGIELKGKIDARITNGDPPAVIRQPGEPPREGTFADIKDGYTMEPTYGVKVGYPGATYPELEMVMRDMKMYTEPPYGYTQQKIRTKNMPEGATNDQKVAIINENTANRDQGILVSSWSYQEADLTVADMKLPWSELTYQSWKLEAKGKVGGLNKVIRQNVQSADTTTTVEVAYTKNGFAANQKGEFVADPANPAMDEAFTALLNTDNVKGVKWMLSDHRDVFNGKDIKKIVVYPKGMDGSGNKLTIVLWIE